MQMAVAFMLAYPYGYPILMSSFFFDDPNQGPPNDGNYNFVSPTINPSETCGDGWVREHRWRLIFSMVEFRNVVAGIEYSSNLVTFHQYWYLKGTVGCVNIVTGRYRLWSASIKWFKLVNTLTGCWGFFDLVKPTADLGFLSIAGGSSKIQWS